eukprot:1908331-Amphidinium_carterae.1
MMQPSRQKNLDAKLLNHKDGHLPSLTQIIPCYDETVRHGKERTSRLIVACIQLERREKQETRQRQRELHACQVINSEEMLRDSDGVNTNLGFIISLYPDEWDYFAQGRVCTWRQSHTWHSQMPHTTSKDLCTAFDGHAHSMTPCFNESCPKESCPDSQSSAMPNISACSAFCLMCHRGVSN